MDDRNEETIKGEERRKLHRVLCVDNDVSVCETMQIILRLRGYEAYGVNSPLFALQKLKDNDFDLVITDLVMPGIDGIELIRRIRKMKPDQRIIAVTGFPSPRTQGQAFKLGSLNYLAKPFTGSRLVEAVDDALSDDEEEGLVGSVHLTSEELIQLYSFSQRSVTLQITNNGQSGYIYMEMGNPVHSVLNDLEGEEALYEILSWKTGIFVALPFCKTHRRTIHKCADAVLLEDAKRKDECNACGRDCIIHKQKTGADCN